ncbi:MAG: Cys-Gln thioester bond-forming surface protein [Firmicutes bacterium]|nr:Cys-Gln thioester bond-forming surface protein [Bacillota bacterium]
MKKRMQKLFTVMLIISVMMSMMSIGAYAAEPGTGLEFICGKEVHMHDETCACGETQDFVCTADEHSHEGCECICEAEYDFVCTAEEHSHDETCFALHVCDETCTYVPCAQNGNSVLTCTETPHQHSEVGGECYAVHTHVDACYTCGAAAHSHGDGCYAVHECDEDCYICGKEEHKHVTACVAKEPNIWYGNQVSREIAAGKDGYTFISHYQKPYHAYEMSNHMVSSDGGAHNDIPQTLMMLDANKDYTWSPSGVYEFGASNYEVMYCCDAVTGYNDGIYYKRMNLEDSDYYDKEDAAHIRAIITNSYPYVSLEQMKVNLAAEGFAGAAELTRADVIAAVQMAVWSYANDAHALKYSQTFDVASNSQWGGVLHDYTNEMKELDEETGEFKVWWKTGKKQFTVDNAVGDRINELADHLKAKDKIYADEYQVVITDLKIVDTIPVQEKDGVYNVVIQVVLNNGGSSVNDDIQIQITVDGEVVKTEKPELGKTVYNFTVPVKAGQKLDAVVSGTQILPEGVYFYEPEGGRDASQSLVGVAAGATTVYAKASTTPDLPEVEVKADLNLQKVGSFGQVLKGAEFELSVMDSGNAYSMGTFPVDGNGKLAVEDLLPGTYQLAETAAPEGFQKLSAPVEFTVSEEGEFILVSNAGNMAYISGDVLNVRNNPVVSPYYPPYEEETPAVTPEEPPLVEVEDPEVPLEDIEVEDPDVPLIDMPEVEIEEEEVPLTDVPKTGDSSNMMLWMMMALLSAAALVGIRIAERKER